MKKTITSIISGLLVICLLFTMSVTVVANEAIPLQKAVTEDYATFLESLKILENYAESYVSENSGDSKELLINYIRTGV